MDNKQKHYWLYVLKLEQGKYYVGITTKTPTARMKQHVNKFAGAAWTRTYKPIKILDEKDLGLVTYEQASVYENRVVRKYMDEKGINNVRGGDLSHPDDLAKRFGWYIDALRWHGMVAVVILLLIIFILGFKLIYSP